jgi:transposase-like protein
MSSPEIAIHNFIVMEKGEKVAYEKRSQKDYSMSFKLGVVSEVESGTISVTAAKRKYGIQGRATVVNWLRKYGTFDWENQTPSNMPMTQEQRLMELEAKVKLLKHGGAEVSPAHANFVFYKGASARAILELSVMMREAVWSMFGVWLEYEMEILGSMPKDMEASVFEERVPAFNLEKLTPLRERMKAAQARSQIQITSDNLNSV